MQKKIIMHYFPINPRIKYKYKTFEKRSTLNPTNTFRAVDFYNNLLQV